eukprot:CAMPEP_0114531064 /NCGR_PEP_ID=MMETSP0109-20121206/25828_1 /TAXON_ID=29199 /ORGANISM="Chlorarachnion reptans, Strain CCCM449" /LENGTH=64 /DNA_ID=CAMNT_0001713827 /DNA_START=407 /DNA_END=601 /DNA_ORIENTATION=+
MKGGNVIGWLQVRQEKPITINGKRYVSEEHHIKESSYLIKTIRELAQRIDELENRNSSSEDVKE